MDCHLNICLWRQNIVDNSNTNSLKHIIIFLVLLWTKTKIIGHPWGLKVGCGLDYFSFTSQNQLASLNFCVSALWNKMFYLIYSLIYRYVCLLTISFLFIQTILCFKCAWKPTTFLYKDNIANRELLKTTYWFIREQNHILRRIKIVQILNNLFGNETVFLP